MKNSHLPRLICTLFFCFVATVVTAQEVQQQKKLEHKISVRAEKDSAIYRKGEAVVFNVRLSENNQPLVGKEIQYIIQGDGGFEQNGSLQSADPVATIRTKLDRPGFLKCTVTWKDADGKQIAAMAGAGVDPLEIRAATPEPSDFDEFWNAKLKELAELPMNEKLVPVDAEKVNNPNVEVYDIKVDCLGGKPVSGYFAKPVGAKPKSLPIIINYHGAGVYTANMPISVAARNTLALDVNAHGIENGQPATFYSNLNNEELKGYPTRGGDDREKLYFVGMFLRVARSIQFMKAQPEWDGKTIVVKGSSQGGGQALVAAGIDSDVNFCVAYVPAICYPLGAIENCFDGWPGFLRNKNAQNADPQIVKSVPYIDAANFARRIKAESILSTGFIDYVCSPTSVYVAYNNIQAPKRIITTPETDHSVSREASETAEKLLWEFVEKNRN